MAWELIKHTTTGSGFFYIGQAEEATFDVTLPPEELPGISWFADKITSALVEAAREEGVILETKVYFDPSSWYDCKYRVIVVGHGSPLAWSAIIIAALVVAALGLIAWILHSVQDVKWFGAAAIGLGIGAAALGVGYLVKTTKKRSS